jgi:hypothetical protein
MSSVAQVLLLAFVLRMALVRSGSGERRRGRRGERIRRPRLEWGKAAVVVIFGPLTEMPAAMWLEPDRAERLHGWWQLALTVLGALAAYGLVRMTAPERLKRRHPVMFIRAVLLLTAVFAVNVVALSEGVPVNYRARSELVIALVVTLAFLCCCRVADLGYYPFLLLAEAGSYAVVVVLVLWWDLAAGLPATPPAQGPGRLQLAALLLAATAAVAVTGLAVGGWRLRHWLVDGPPADPGPPLVRHWPPLPGEVWLALIEHDDERSTHKERPVLVWERADTHLLVLTFTTTDRSALPGSYLGFRKQDFDGVLTKDAWLSRETTAVPYSEFLVFRGDCPTPAWDRLIGRDVVRAGGRAPLALSLRYRLRSAWNRHVGPDARDVADAGRRVPTPRPRAEQPTQTRSRRRSAR